jgi:hypothetical protein
LIPAPNENNSLSPPNGERAGGEGFELVNIGLLTPALSSLREAREINGACVKLQPFGNPFESALVLRRKSFIVMRKIFMGSRTDLWKSRF